MENFVLLQDDKQLDSCYAKSLTSAQIEFSMRGWVIGDVMSLEDYHSEMQLNALENQSAEC